MRSSAITSRRFSAQAASLRDGEGVPVFVDRLVRADLVDDVADSATTDPWGETEPALAGLAAASVRGWAALGARTGHRVHRRGVPPERGPCHAHQDGFDLHAALRPPVAADRLRLTTEGLVVIELRRRWSDGTTHLVFDPVELLERLAALTPRPRINLGLYYGVLGTRAAWRPQVVPRTAAGAPSTTTSRRAGRLWADLMRRSFGFDVLACPRCGGRLRLVALIEDPLVIRRILGHLDHPTEIPEPRPARAPPLLVRGPTDSTFGHDPTVDFGA